MQPAQAAQASGLIPHPQSTNQYTILQSFQEPHLSKGQRWRLQQWILRVSSLFPAVRKAARTISVWHVLIVEHPALFGLMLYCAGRLSALGHTVYLCCS